MAEIEPLISTSQLKTTRLTEYAKNRQLQPTLSYDRDFDALVLLLVPPETQTIVHYLDEHVALLFELDTLEIVGLQVEDFEHSFLPQHASVQRVWRLSDTGVTPENFGDLILAVERMKPVVAREVVKASEDVLGEPGEKLIAALA